jgi:hypothetical protein
MQFGTTVTTTLGFDEAVARTREALGLPALQPVADEAGRRLSAALKTVAEA